MTLRIARNPYWIFVCLIITMTACNTNKSVFTSSSEAHNELTQVINSNGGFSGMEQIDDQSYLVVYDLKRSAKGIRLGLIKVTHNSFSVLPIPIISWDKWGVSNDLESICAIPDTPNEYLIAESGDWQGQVGRIFHIKVDTSNLNATVMGSVNIPMLHRNDINSTGDQYEAITCLPYDGNNRILILGERGGSKSYPNGVVRWGVLNIHDHLFEMNEEGHTGIEVNVPGNWKQEKTKRGITDFHIDPYGGIWASASEDPGDMGPFYSVIYKLGQTNALNKEKPFIIFETIDITKEVNGLKIEALSGPCKDIMGSHTFGTEDEIYGGVWRPLNIE